MTPEEVMNVLYSYCLNNYIQGLNLLLSEKEYRDKVDLLYKDGYAFSIAVGLKKAEVLKVLLNFYHETQIDCKEGMERDVALVKLKSALREGYEIEGFVSEEVEKILKKYIKLDEESPGDEQDLTGIEIPEIRDFEDDEEQSIDQSSTAAGSLVHRQLHSSNESLESSKASSHEREAAGQNPDIGHTDF